MNQKTKANAKGTKKMFSSRERAPLTRGLSAKLTGGSGITLIALVITIIVLLILAGVTISMVLGDDGIIQNAQTAKKLTEEAEREEGIKRALLGDVMDEYFNTDGGENAFKTNLQSIFGEEYTITVGEKDEETGNMTVTLTKGTEVYKYTVSSSGQVAKQDSGAGDANPTPDPTPSNPHIAKYINEIPVPIGFEAVEKTDGVYYTEDEGFVITDGTNEFVWVPVSASLNFPTLIPGYYNGAKQTFVGTEPSLEPNNGTLDSETYEEEYDKMVASVEKYGGFYVGRYETNSEYGSTKEATPINKVTWYAMYNGQKGLYPDEETNETGVVSGMIYGCQWDAIMDWMKDEPNPTLSNKTYIEDSTGMGWHYGVEGNSTHLTGKDLLAPDGTVLNKVKNIYDLAGNMYDWTQEAGSNNRVTRGGSYNYSGSFIPASGRETIKPDSDGVLFYSSRLQLYIKVAQ